MHSPTISGMHTQGGSGSGSGIAAQCWSRNCVPGMEITVGIAGNRARVRVIGSMEVAPVNRDYPFVYSLEVKRDFRRQVRYCVPPRLAPVLAKRSNVSPLPPIACSVAATSRGSTSGSMRMVSRGFSSAIPCRSASGQRRHRHPFPPHADLRSTRARHPARGVTACGDFTPMKRVLVLHTLPPEQAPPGRERDEFDVSGSAQAIAEARAVPGAAVVGVRGELREVLDAIAGHRPDVVFNLCEAPLGRPGARAARRSAVRVRERHRFHGFTQRNTRALPTQRPHQCRPRRGGCAGAASRAGFPAS